MKIVVANSYRIAYGCSLYIFALIMMLLGSILVVHVHDVLHAFFLSRGVD